MKNDSVLIRMNKLQQMRNSIKNKLVLKPKNSSTSLKQIQKKDIDQGYNSDGSNNTKAKQSIYNIAAFSDKYQMGEIIGYGMNGNVYKCTHVEKKKIFAVKKMKLQIENILFLKQNFYQVKKLKHPCLVRYNALYIEPKNRTCYLVMELFSHPQLALQKINEQKQLKNIIHKLLEAVQYLHLRGFCHRDIKPQNILYDKQTGEIRLIDFGVSKKFRIRKFIKQMVTSTGTQFYKAPQMITGGVYTEIIDEWAVGVTLYKLITGITPFQSAYIGKVNKRIQAGVVHYDENIWSKYGRAKDLVSNLLKPPKQRLKASQAINHLWFDNNSLDVSSSIRIPLSKKFSLQDTEINMMESYPCVNNPILQSLKEQDEQYLRQSLTGSLKITEQAWVHSEQQDSN